uniref:Uncharacterized protein n=1 Tax=Moniliophthora roreri TaxID=221103 RepID=A0A0W0FBA2_MONRR
MPLHMVPSFSVYCHLLCGSVICFHFSSKVYVHLFGNQSSISFL